MKKTILICLLTVSFASNADIVSDLRHCSTIKVDSERLDCFDLVTANTKNLESLSSKVKATQPHSTPGIDKKINSDIINISKEDAFGKSSSELSDLKSIQSHIKGSFKGWQKGDILTLANGQKWQVTSNNAGYVNLENPEVEISQGFWGSFNMKVKGLNAQSKVKRIN